MTYIGKTLTLMADQKVWLASELSAALSLALVDVYPMLGRLVRLGFLAKPERGNGYVITEQGLLRVATLGQRSPVVVERMARAARARRLRERSREVSNLPIVQQAQILSPVSVWAYAERAAA